MLLPSEGRLKTIVVVQGLGPDVLSDEDKGFFKQVVDDNGADTNISEDARERLDVIQLAECFSDVGSKSQQITDGITAAANNPQAPPPPAANDGTMLVEYFDYLFRNGEAS